MCKKKGEDYRGKQGKLLFETPTGEMSGRYSFTHGGSGYIYQSRSSCTYFCLSRDSRDLGRFGRFAVDGMEWMDELFLLEDWDEWEEWERLARDWPALWSNCIKQKIRSVGTSSNSYGGLVMTYLDGESKDVTEWGWLSRDFTSLRIRRNCLLLQFSQRI